MHLYKKILAIVILLFLLVNVTIAQQNSIVDTNEPLKASAELEIKSSVEDLSKPMEREKQPSDSEVEQHVEVGKHLNAELDAASMILSLFLVLGVIIVSAMLLKRFQLSQQYVSGLKVVTNLNLGNKERIVVVQVGEKQLLLGVTTQQISLLERLDEPLPAVKSEDLSNSHPLLKFLQKRTANN